MSPSNARNLGGGSSILGPPTPGAIGGRSVITMEGASAIQRCLPAFANAACVIDAAAWLIAAARNALVVPGLVSGDVGGALA